jgi:DNA-binding MarR family transcriptional regulator
LRRRLITLILLAILGALVLVALPSLAQTPPPSSGDWIINDTTTFSDTTVDLPGNLIVEWGGRLILDNVDVTFTQMISTLMVNTGGRIIMDGGSIDTSSAIPPRISLGTNNSFDRVAFTTYPLNVYGLGTSITNCTFETYQSSYISVNILSGHPLDGPIVIAHNKFTDVRNPIVVYVSNVQGMTVKLVILGNEISSTSMSKGITFNVTTPSADIVVRENMVTGTGMDGLYLDLKVDDLRLRMDTNIIQDSDMDGVRLFLTSKDLDMPGIVDLQVDTADGFGFRMESMGDLISNLTLANLTIKNASKGGVSLAGVYNVSLISSHIDSSGTDFIVDRGTIDIYRTYHDVGDAMVNDINDRVSSWREIDMTCVWQNGAPVVEEQVDILDLIDQPKLTGVTDQEGYWGLQLFCGWCLDYSNGLQVVNLLEPILVHPRGNITNGQIPADDDQKVTVTFNDTVMPVIQVVSPSSNHIQNTTLLSISGMASDLYSGVHRVQFSFDPNPDWDAKIWTDTMGAEEWSVDALHLSQGEHTLYMRAYDKAALGDGEYGQATVDLIVIDLTPPAIQVTAPDHRGRPVVVRGSPLTVEGWTNEEVSKVTVDGTTLSMPGTTFSLPVDLTEGLNDITVEATDLAGNTGTITIQIILDTGSPNITLNAPAPGALLNTASVLIAGQVDEPMLGDLVKISGVPVTLSDGTFELLLSNLDEGPHTFDVVAIDLAGNTETLFVNVIVDTLPPALKLVSPNDGLTNQATVLVEGTSEAGAYLTISGTQVPLNGDAFSYTMDLLEGRNVITVTVADAAGNVNSTQRVVDLDTVAPSLIVNYLDNGTLYSVGNLVDISGATEPGARVIITILDIEVEALVYPDGSFVQTLTIDVSDTPVTVRAEDTATNGVSLDLSVILEETSEPLAPPPTTIDPVVTAAVVTTSMVVLVGVAMTFEFSKYALVLMLLPMYARIKKQEVLDNKTRLAIHGLVVENPGMHYNEIIREFGLTNGVAAYHLDVLEREGFVRSIRDGTLRRFYSSSSKVPKGHKATPDQVREHILEIVNENPGVNQKTLVDELGISRTLVGYHIKTLIDEGYIEAHKQGRFTVYSRTRKRWFRLN